MNHGSIGFINEDGKLAFEQEILNTLCLGVDSKLYGVYYPRHPKEEYPEYAHATIKHDFMLTPIPPRFWPVSARIHLHLSHKPKSLDAIGNYFNAKKVSVIHSELTRSAYRYVTWSMHIAFEELLKLPKLNYDKEKNYYEETFNALNELINEINNSKSLNIPLFLFSPDYFNSAGGTVNAPLAYFTNFFETAEEKKWIEEPDLIKPFELKVENKNGHLLNGDKQFQYVLSYLKRKNNEFLPAVTFAELHTRSLNLRAVILSANDRKRFFRVELQYERVGGEDTCIGLIHFITKRMPSKYNIWQSYNYVIDSSRQYEKGDLVFLIEDTSNVDFSSDINFGRDPRPLEGYIAEAENIFQDIAKESPALNTQFSKPIISALPEPPILEGYFKISYEERQRGPFQYDLFISYSHSDATYVTQTLLPILQSQGLSVHLDALEIQFGDFVDSSLLNNILGSMEMCVVVSDISTKSEWVTTEWGASWILSKKITPVILNPTEIPYRLRGRLYIDGTVKADIEKYAKQILGRKLLNSINRFKRGFGK